MGVLEYIQCRIHDIGKTLMLAHTRVPDITGMRSILVHVAGSIAPVVGVRRK